MDSRCQKLHTGSAWRGAPPREIGSRRVTDDVMAAWTGKQSRKHSGLELMAPSTEEVGDAVSQEAASAQHP